MATQIKRKFHDPMDDILDRPTAFNPAFKRITGSTVAALFLSQAWYWSKRHEHDNGWFYKVQSEWEDEIGLTRSEQETARKHLKEQGLLEEVLRDVPARMYYRVIKENVYVALGIQYATSPQTENAETPQTSNPANSQYAGKQQSDIPANINRNTMTPPMIPNTDADASERAEMTNPNSGNHTDATVLGDPLDGILASAKHAQENLEETRLADAVNQFPPAYQEFAKAFTLATGIFPISKDVSGWCLAFKDQLARTGLSAQDITEACKQMYTDKLTIKDPFSVMGKAGDIHVTRAKRPVKQPPAPVSTPLTKAMETFVPGRRPARSAPARQA